MASFEYLRRQMLYWDYLWSLENYSTNHFSVSRLSPAMLCWLGWSKSCFVKRLKLFVFVSYRAAAQKPAKQKYLTPANKQNMLLPSTEANPEAASVESRDALGSGRSLSVVDLSRSSSSLTDLTESCLKLPLTNTHIACSFPAPSDEAPVSASPTNTTAASTVPLAILGVASPAPKLAPQVRRSSESDVETPLKGQFLWFCFVLH